jgi:hypothetical protein
MKNLSILDAKERLQISDLWRHFGFPGEPRKCCQSPFRLDRRASFSVTPDGKLWHDFATGEAGDAVDFLQRASGLSRKEACRKFIELAGGHSILPSRVAQLHCKPADAKLKPAFPEFTKGTLADFKQLASIRNLSREGLKLASGRGLLWFATLKNCPAWLVTDAARVNAQARRMDGKLWMHLPKPAKAYTLPGSWASWPIGVMEVRPFRAIAFCEGGPDLLAACHFIVCESREVDCAPVAMMGARQHIHPDALPLLAGKRIRIFTHADADGTEAAKYWAEQLTRIGVVVDAFDFAGLRKVDGSPVNDLNDLTQIAPDDFENDRELWEVLP